MGHEDLFGFFVSLGGLSGIALIIWTSMMAKIARIKAEAQVRQMTAAPLPEAGVTAELKALRQQIAEMQSTGHQFDISFDAALERLESRVNRLETKSATTTSTAASEPGQTLRNGQSL